MNLIVDSGSSKATWHVSLHGGMSFTMQTTGINPVRDSVESMSDIIRSTRSRIDSELTHGRAGSFQHDSSFGHVWFYGAGCQQPFAQPLARLLETAFCNAEVCVESDLLGAARALCQHSEGMACILGTGSNSCLYDGTRIVAHTPALGWIIGDEGSGAVLGRTLVGDVLKGQLPENLCRAFLDRFGLTQERIIDAVYRQPQPNRFLASLVPFLTEHRTEPSIHDLLVNAFRSFFVRNVAAYSRRDLSVGFVGGVAYQFENELREAAHAELFNIGRILKDPMPEMARFHGC